LIKSKLLQKFNYIHHGFFDSKNGYSKGIYKSLNCGFGTKDKKININKNIQKVCKRIKCKKKNLVILKQVHSNKVHIINKILKKKIEGDSLITKKKNIALGILTADCAPIFIVDYKKKIIAAVHSGWRGAFKNIVKKTVSKLINQGAKIDNLIAVIGPCIKQKNYEVKKDFLKKFIKKDLKNRKFFLFKRKKIYFDLNKYIKSQLEKIGIKNIETINIDTFDIKNYFFSFRRSLKKNYDDYGRNISIIMIK